MRILKISHFSSNCINSYFFSGHLFSRFQRNEIFQRVFYFAIATALAHPSVHYIKHNLADFQFGICEFFAKLSCKRRKLIIPVYSTLSPTCAPPVGDSAGLWRVSECTRVQACLIRLNRQGINASSNTAAFALIHYVQAVHAPVSADSQCVQ